MFVVTAVGLFSRACDKFFNTLSKYFIAELL